MAHKEDVEYFKKITINILDDLEETEESCKEIENGYKNAVIMGSKTYLSIPEKFRPLEKRFNVIITKNVNFRQENNIPNTVMIFYDFDTALKVLNTHYSIKKLFVIGGSDIYDMTIKHELCSIIYRTLIDDSENEIKCDRFFPKIDPEKFELISKKVGANVFIDKKSNTEMKYYFEVYSANS